MRYVVDLHSHSGYAGGVGDISLETVAVTMARKGIHVFGVGDCLQPAWRERLESLLKTNKKEPGLFALDGAPAGTRAARFVLQTEVIFTNPVASGGRKGTHVVLLFPDFAAADDAIRLLRKWEVKLDMGRPFIKADSPDAVADRCRAFKAIDPSVMIIPAHVMTPQGVYGSDHPVDGLAEVFGDFAGEITTVETGLSADPALLALLPELDGRTFISNSDCHSGALNRVGREFTALDVAAPSYGEIVSALRGRRVLFTAEFNPAEGRYFLTGHRAGLERHGGAYCYFSPDRVPADGRCPICGKRLTVGVLDRLLYLSKKQSADGRGRALGSVQSPQKARALIPLVEVIAAGLGVKSVSSRKVIASYDAILHAVGTEMDLWDLAVPDMEKALRDIAPAKVLTAIAQVTSGDFSFRPGFDGQYGGLCLGEQIGWFGHDVVHLEE